MVELVKHSGYLNLDSSEHPSLKPLAKFHGRIVKTFSELPENGKVLEIAKRVLLVALSPFAYPALAFVGIVGYPFTATDSKQVSSLKEETFEQCEEASEADKNPSLESKSIKKSEEKSQDVPREDLNKVEDEEIPSNDSNTVESGTIDNSSEEKNLSIEDFRRLTQELYSHLLLLNGKNNLDLPLLTSKQLCVFFITGEVQGVINETRRTLDVFVDLGKKIEKDLTFVSKIVSKDNPEVLENIDFPTIDDKSDLWSENVRKIIQSQNLLSNFLTKSEFFNQARVEFGSKGEWFAEISNALKEFYDYYDSEYDHLCKSYEVLSNRLDQLNSSHSEKIKVKLLDHKTTFMSHLFDLDQKVRAFDLVRDTFEEILKFDPKSI